MDRLKLAALGERLKIGRAQMSRTISEKMKEIMQAHTQEEKMVDEATSDSLEEPNWDLNLKICSLLKDNKLSGVELLQAIKKRISGKSTVGQRLSLDLLEACAMNCEKVFSEISSEEVLDEIVKMIDNPQTHFSNKRKALQLIRTWGELEELRYLPVFRQTHMSLKARETPFVTERDLNMETIIIPNEPSVDRRAAFLPVSNTHNGAALPVKENGEIMVITRNSVQLLSSMLNSDTQQMSVLDDATMSLVEKCKQLQPVMQRIIESTSDESVLLVSLSLHEELQVVLSKYREIQICAMMPN